MPYIDPQINGYAGVNFHDPGLTAGQLDLVASALRRDNCEAILPTLVTDSIEAMTGQLRRMRELIDRAPQLRALMPAFHIEGPCLSPVEGYRGAHCPEHIRPATPDLMEKLVEAGGGPARVAMVTLAPEVDRDLATTRWLHDHGILIAVGHTDAPLSLLREAEDAGVSLFTHFGNGSAAQMNRHDNIIQRGLALEKIRYTLIPDGHHLPFFLLRNWIRLLGHERCLFTTDCCEAAGAPRGTPLAAKREIDYSTDTPVVRFRGTPYLSGSALTPPMGYRNAVEHLGLPAQQAKYMWYDHIRQLLKPWLART